jgi:hypothetical protein
MSINKIGATREQREHRKNMSFKQFLRSEPNNSAARSETNRVSSAMKKKLREAADVDSDVGSSIFAAIYSRSSNREATLQLLADEIHKMSETLNIAVTCVPIT